MCAIAFRRAASLSSDRSRYQGAYRLSVASSRQDEEQREDLDQQRRVADRFDVDAYGLPQDWNAKFANGGAYETGD